MIQLNRSQAAFGRHATFPLRYAWLTKGVQAIRSTPQLFSNPEAAMVELGVGRNMVSAMQYWLQVTRLIDFSPATPQITALGEALLGDHADPYLEDDATLWIIHWLIVSNPALATGFYWFFNHFAMPRFREPELHQALLDFIARELQVRRSASTIKSDCSTLLRLYAASASGGDDHLDSPLAPLKLIEADAQGYRSPRLARPFLPPLALHVALADRFDADPDTPALPVRVLLYGGDDWPAVGAAFRLTEDGLMAALVRVMEQYPGYYELRDTAGVHQLYRRMAISPVQILRDQYREHRV
ncbi:DUF4007 family protein [Allochromatium warmingii]|uniref:DUF4007 family protein n=1 Tax=Allochromatium warmingii TaxID=61595 RepID=UPI001FE15196|nr:DUF4007 family protein [Allochromatium warmingii]